MILMDSGTVLRADPGVFWNRECISLKVAKIKWNRRGYRVFFGRAAVRFL